MIMSSKNLWHFANVRMADGRDDFFRLLRNHLIRECYLRRMRIGEEVSADATPIRSLQNDDIAPYSGHYKRNGYKLDFVNDMKHDLPLSKEVLYINEKKWKDPDYIPDAPLSCVWSSSMNVDI
jgi:hypothetical protein